MKPRLVLKSKGDISIRYNADLEEVTGEGITDEYSEVLDALSRLPDKLKIPVYLFYYHGYNSKEIASILKDEGFIKDYKVIDGYGIMQPRIGMDLGLSQKTYFFHTFTPYNHTQELYHKKRYKKNIIIGKIK